VHITSSIIFTLFLIFAGAAVLSTVALFTRQSLLVAYIVLGVLFGPWCLKLVNNAANIQHTGDVGIIFLLFLLGLHLHPQNLFHMFKKMTWVALVSSLIFGGIAFFITYCFHYSLIECLLIGAASMFSSTIIGLKLLPTTVLEQQHTGEIMTSILLVQDLIAIVLLLLLDGASTGTISWFRMCSMVFTLPVLFFLSYLVSKYVLMKLMERFKRMREYIFLLSLAWCLTMAQLGSVMGLSAGIGAFIAGVAIAANPISDYIADSLKPLRDFFLVLFFFSIGATFDFQYLPSTVIPAVVLAVVMLVLKPIVFRFLLRQVQETKHIATEIGVRLGQMSEFSLMVIYVAVSTHLVGNAASSLLQAATILTFVVSSYIVVLRYPTPVAVIDEMRRD
jgi:Kef-type K+ transport system membrane component KefB